MSVQTTQFRYHEVLQKLLARLRTETVMESGRMPPLRELAREIGVSMVTLRRAIAVLTDRGVLVSRHGCGVYVVNKERGLVVETEILSPVPGRLSVCIVDSFADGDYTNKLKNSFVYGQTLEGARKACLRDRYGLKALSFVHGPGRRHAIKRILSSP